MLGPLLLAATLALPNGNLLLGRAAEGRGLSGGAAATDGLLAPEGAPGTEAALVGRAARLEGKGAFLVIDLGEPRTVGALLLQADASDTCVVEGSLDGKSWAGLLRAAPDGAPSGVRTRRAPLPAPRELRFLLIRAEGGEGAFFVAELAAFASAPASWSQPPAAPEGDATARATESRLVAASALLALLAALLLGFGVVLRRRGTPGRLGRPRDLFLAALGALSVAAFVNFGAFHSGRFVHVWDAYHYVLGAKYFPELGYTGLYEATLAAERAAGLLPPGATLPVRDLSTNEIRLVSADDALAAWTARLGPRWPDFVTDVLWFRTRTTPEHFRGILLDHGYNATPAWEVLGSALARAAGPVTDRSIRLLALIDPLLLLGAWLLVGRAFGWRTTCVALVVWGTLYPSRFAWTGGSFLRMDWLAAAMVGIALLRLGRPRLAGAALAVSTLLRVFPGALLLGLGVAAAARFAKERTLESVRQELRVAQGALLATAVLLPLSLLAAGGYDTLRWGAWGEFAANSRKHLATPLTNNVGLGTAVSWRPGARGEALVKDGPLEPWKPWKEARREALAATRPARIVLAAAFLAAVAYAFRSRPPWQAVAAGAGLVFVLADLTSYYAAILLLLALLHAGREEAGLALAALCAATGAVPFLLSWEDDRYALVSLLVVAAYGLLLALLARKEEPSPPTPRAA